MDRRDFLVSFRGTKNGLIIVFDDTSSFEKIRNKLRKKLESSGYFFFGASVIIDTGKLQLTKKQILEIRDILQDKHGMKIHTIECKSEITKKNAKELNLHTEEYSESDEEETENQPQQTEKSEKEASDVIRKNEYINDLETKIFKKSLRSGQRIEFDGNVIILGDINPGAEVIASGDIIIFGSLRGMAFAGAKGRTKSFVLANKFQPTQIRIADKLARPGENVKEVEDAEFAAIENGEIVIDSWHKTNF